MRRLAAVLSVFLLQASAAAATQVFEGAWFRISYPDGFVVSGSLPSTTNDGFDSAFFRDPERRIEFYVFSPQAGGTATDIAPDVAREKLVATEESRSEDRTFRWTTYATKDGTHFRSIEEMRTTDRLQVRVFAIKYRSTDELAAFRKDYMDFKQSFQAFAD